MPSFLKVVGLLFLGCVGLLTAVIVLSGAAFFENQEAVAAFPPVEGGERRLFYIRYRTNPLANRRVRPRPGMRPTGPQPPSFPMPVDDLEHVVEPLEKR